MIRDLKRFSRKTYDLLVIGGGINGAAIAYLAASTGASVALLEKGDFAGGTSSKSTKLMHGGLRYLEHLEFDLVAESLKERYIQWKSAPHLVKPMAFVIPVYRGDPRGLWQMRLGVWLYDALSGAYTLGGHRTLSKKEVVRHIAGINPEGLVGGVEYFDAQMDDARLCLENVLMADKHGAHAANHAEVMGFLKNNGRTVGARVQDARAGTSFDVLARQIVVAAGPWSDMVLHKDAPRAKPCLRGTKGAHVVYRGRLSDRALLVPTRTGKRVIFIIPFKGNTLIGTTDTDYADSPDDVRCDEDDVAYLLGEANRILSGRTLQKENVIMTFAGVRPLVHDRGTPSQVSRRHVIKRALSGVYYVLGGKYTTYRAIARECVAKALPEALRAYGPLGPEAGQCLGTGDQHPLYGSPEQGQEDAKAAAEHYSVGIDIVEHLMGVYGSRFADVLALTREDPSLKGKLCSCSPSIRAQVVYAIKVEMARTVEDVFDRRLGLVYTDCPTRQCRLTIEEMLRDA
ncbi:MAG TPA: glycerol-3-phosphate dehydrogenase/oxidase [Candidatus Omnitrophota bacterium]|nr:glycerol-3-phosphate dehydrogenase/oxidase [Candidatus Omnitrophota bacterium]